MTREELYKLLIEEKDPQKAKALAEVIAAQEKAEADIRKAEIEQEISDERVAADRAKAEAEKEANLARVRADEYKTRTEHEEAYQKHLDEVNRADMEERVEKKNRILGWFKLIGTILLGLFTGGVTIYNARAVMKFEETGSIRTKAWTGVKPDRPNEIR